MQDAAEESAAMKINKTYLTFQRAIILGISMVALFVAKTSDPTIADQVHACEIDYHSQSKDVDPLNYKVTPFFVPDDPNRFAIIYVTIDQRHFNSHDMRTLAIQLNREFAKQSRLRVALFDDDLIPQLMVKGGVQLSDFHKAQRGQYYLDRPRCKEYIEFSSRKSGPRNEIVIRSKCPHIR